ncbi:hypothetical protein ACD591_20495 [Rufibacter glacialis]|uniref:EF-hand domain-containing protein n=1 Tax=Rufibacter glacialis TaxID=1259555 RepID=A0A5M8QAY7_9BACT|nr:hypothetical protein [Rufibacter glacialis]KAA6432273.1 hypothetical protein FOE74_14265 [Rufibacter glacialis]GGK77307.1 hypothetical protein GCM10011405_26360 [Rufibacter glacialis]
MKEKIKDINQGDLLTFRAADGRYKVLLCTSTYKDKSPQNYTFAALTVDEQEKPTKHRVIEGGFYGVGNRKDDYFKYSDRELERMWSVHPEVKPYYIGSYGLTIWRKDFMRFQENFEIIGNLEIVNNLDKNGNGSMNASDWDFLRDFFNGEYHHLLLNRGQKLFRIESIIKH